LEAETLTAHRRQLLSCGLQGDDATLARLHFLVCLVNFLLLQRTDVSWFVIYVLLKLENALKSWLVKTCLSRFSTQVVCELKIVVVLVQSVIVSLVPLIGFPLLVALRQLLELLLMDPTAKLRIF